MVAIVQQTPASKQLPSPRYVERFLTWLDRAGIVRESVPYTRSRRGGEGGTVAALRLVPPTGLGLRTPVLFAHATGNDALFPQLGLFRALLAKGHPVLTFDLDGHGRESTTTLAVDGTTGMLGDARQALTGSASAPVHVVGQSLGGALALAAVATGELAPATVRSLTLLSTPLLLSPAARMLGTELLGMARASVRSQLRHYGPYGLLPAMGPFKRRAYPIRLADGEARAPLAYVDVVTRLVAGLDLTTLATRVRVPTLLVYGIHDKLVPPEQGRALAGLIPDADLRLVPGGTHFSTPFEPGVEGAITGHVAAAEEQGA